MSKENKPRLAQVAVQLILVVVIAPLLPLIISGDWGWW